MNYRDLILADGPSLYWPLDDTYGATDQSGNGYNGTGGGGITIGGQADSPISGETTSTAFDGSNDTIASSYSPFVNGTTRTFTGWTYRNNSSGNDNLIGSSAASIFFWLRLVGGGNDVAFRADQVSSTTTTWSGAWPGNAVWVHWAFIFNESTNDASLYINGALVSTQSHATGYNAAPGTFEVGTANAGANAPLPGRFAHVAVWERALTASEIKGHYRAAAATGNPADKTYIHQARRGQ